MGGAGTTDWITPAEALRRAEAAYGSKPIAADHIRTLLRDAVVKAVAATAVRRADYEKEYHTSNIPIPADQWPGAAWHGNEEFWRTARIELIEGRYKRWSYLQVRIDGAALTRQLPAPLPAAEDQPPAALPPSPITPQPAPTVKPDKIEVVTPSALKIWAEAFAKIHKGEDILQPIALKSAEGMFPDKTVSRDRIVAAVKAAGITFSRGPKKRISGE